MPSASSNNNNSNKLEKQNSVVSVHAGGGVSGSGGSSGGAGSVAQTASVDSNAANNNNENIATISNTNKEKSPSAAAGAGTSANSSTTTATTTGGVAATATSNSSTTASTNNNTANANNDTNNAMKQALITIEHKIRNLEKRKTKLESYRAIQASGKELSSDQKAAVAKYDAVMATLDFARDFSKQMMQLSKDAEKEQRKQARKDLIAKAHSETAKIREVLIIQNILSCFSDDAVRNDFLNGENGAVKLQVSDLDILEKFCLDIQTRRPETADDPAFVAITQKAAEYFSLTIDGRPKQFGETTFENLRRIFNQIQECGYLDRIYLAGSDTSLTANDDELPGASGDAAADAKSSSADDGALDESAEKRRLSEGDGQHNGGQQQPPPQPQSAVSHLLAVGDGSSLLLAQHQQQVQQQHPQQATLSMQPTAKEHVDIQQRLNSSLNGPQPPHQQQQQPPQASVQIARPASAGVPSFQAAAAASAGSATTPVHVALFPGQHVQPPNVMISVQPGPQSHVVGAPPPQPQRQMLTSPAAGPAAMPLHAAPAPPGAHYAATTVRAVEQGFFKQHQFMQQMRPLADVIGGGSFYFLQDSELDSPEINSSNAPVYEQQQQQQQKLIQQLGHGEAALEMRKSQEQQQQQQQLLVNSIQQQQQQQSQQPIPTQTFTNQSFPPIQPPQVQHGGSPSAPAAVAANSGNTPTVGGSGAPSPMFPASKHPMFSPVANEQLLLGEQGQQQPPPMMIMGRLAAPQARLPLPHQVQLTGPSSSEVAPAGSAAGFTFDSAVVAMNSYEQQIQQQLANAVALKASAAIAEEAKKQLKKKAGEAPLNDWDVPLKHSVRAAAAAAAAAATNSSSSSHAHKSSTIATNEPTNKWSTEMNSVGTSPVVATTTITNSRQTRKSEWSTVGGAINYDDSAEIVEHHWTNAAQVEAGSAASNAPGTGYSGRTVRGSSSTFQQRRSGGGGGGDDRRDREERRDRPVGERSSGGGGSVYRGGRSNNYGNGSSSSGGGASAPQQNGSRGAGSGGIYFRNNDNGSSGGGGASSSGGSSYYQNGSAYAGGKDGGSSYRGPRGTNASTRGNGQLARSMSGRNGGGGGGGGAAAGNTAPATTYINSRQTSNRITMGLDK